MPSIDSMQEQPAPSRPRKESAEPKAESRRTTPEQREQEAPDREALLGLVTHESLSPPAALELVAQHGPSSESASVETNEFCSSYGLDPQELSDVERQQLAVMLRGASSGRSEQAQTEIMTVLDETLHQKLVERALSKLDTLREEMTHAGSMEEMKQGLRNVMASMSTLAKRVTPDDPKNAGTWNDMYKKFTSLTKLKAGLSKDLSSVFNEVFTEYQGFIEDEFVVRESIKRKDSGQRHSVEKLTHEIFGRTKEEIDELKKRNRVRVTEFIGAHRDEEPSIEILEQLHALNNDGIVPKTYSKLREGDEIVGFGTGRIAIIGPDVREETEAILARATLATLEDVPKSLYEISVAKLHNDLLDIHPFVDRNGSTSMLFAEFMMAKRGYEASPKKDPSYFNYMRKTLGNNPVAMSIIGHGHWQIANVPGYYEGKTTEKRKRIYDLIMKKSSEMKKRAAATAARPALA